jgi:glycosidase
MYLRKVSVGLAVWVLLATWSGRAAAQEPAGHEFRFDAREMNPRPKQVFLAGTFNGWNPTAEAMKDDGTGVFRLRKILNDGVYLYKFVVDGNWTTDPASDRELEESDGHGGMNSAVLIGEDARKLPAPVKGEVRLEGVRFDPAAIADFNVVDDTHVRLGLRVQAGDVDEIKAWVWGGGDGKPQVFPLTRGGVTLGREHWAGLVRLNSRPMRFALELVDGGKSSFLLPDSAAEKPGLKLSATAPEAAQAFVSDARLTFATPEWAKRAVWYQIFPERFRNGETANDPGDKPYERKVDWTSDWWKTQPGETPGDENFYHGAGNVWQRRYGGDIQGVGQQLGYLRSLGVNAIYFNPLFEASSMHKYDARDFRHIDDNFTVKGSIPAGAKSPDPATWEWSAGDREFLAFVAEAKRQGFRVVIDLVCNHVGRNHPYFRDVMEKGEKSEFASWFEIQKFADVHPTTEDLFGKPGGMVFRAWDGMNGNLPVFRHDPKTGLAKGPYEHMMNITRRWLAPDGDASKGVDGFRLDVANEVPSAFWREWRKVVKQTNPDAFISGEIWSPAQLWLEGDQFDGVMNYQFAMAGKRFFVHQQQATTPTQFAREIDRLVSMYPLQAVQALMNLYDSHDTDRLASMFVNPDRPYDGMNRLQDENGAAYSRSRPTAEQWERLKQAIAFQMTFIGSPMLYYGTEAGMWSPDDPSNRMPMVWKDLEPYAGEGVAFNEDVFRSVQRSIAVRNALPALQTGYLRVVSADDDAGVIAFERELLDERSGKALVVVNRSAVVREVSILTALGEGANVVDWMNPEGVELTPPDGDSARPGLRLRSDVRRYEVKGGRVALVLKPWSVAVLSVEAAGQR